MSLFVLDSKTENWLKNHGVRFEYKENIGVEELTPDWRDVNRGRPDGVSVVDEIVEKYASSMLDTGAAFPAPILGRLATGYEVLDGVQRLSAACLIDQTRFNAYIVTTKDVATRQVIRVCANTNNGVAPSLEWTLGRIVDVLFEEFRYSVQDCHLWTGFPVERIKEEIDARRAKRWMEENGIDVSQKPANQKGFQVAFNRHISIAKLREAPDEVVKVVRFCQHLRSNNSEAERLMQELGELKDKKGVKSATQIRSKLQEWQTKPEYLARVKGRSGGKSHPVDNVCRALASALTSAKRAKQEKHSADKAQAEVIVALLHDIKSLCRWIVHREDWETESDIIA